MRPDKSTNTVASMGRRGFTLVELAICLSVTAVLVPITYSFALGLEDRSLLGLWHLETADGVRTVAEELRRDAEQGEMTATTSVGFQIADCAVSYVVTGAKVLQRQASDACGGHRALARDVEAIRTSAGGIDITFARNLRANRSHRATVFIPVGHR